MGGCRKFFCRGVAGYHSFFCLSNALGTDCHILLLWRKPFGFGASGRLPEALHPGGAGRDASHKPLTPTPFPPEVLAASCGGGFLAWARLGAARAQGPPCGHSSGPGVCHLAIPSCQMLAVISPLPPKALSRRDRAD